MKKLQQKQIQLLEEEDKEIQKVLAEQKKVQEKQEEQFKEFTEAAKEFIYPNNVEEKLMAALESPVTLNRPINEYGLTSDEEAKIFTTEKNYRLTPTEQEYFVIRKMKE